MMSIFPATILLATDGSRRRRLRRSGRRWIGEDLCLIAHEPSDSIVCWKRRLMDIRPDQKALIAETLADHPRSQTARRRLCRTVAASFRRKTPRKALAIQNEQEEECGDDMCERRDS